MAKTQSTKTKDVTEIAAESFTRMIEEQMKRLETMYQELQRYNQQALSQSTAGIDEMARLAKDSIAFSGQIAEEWRKVALQTTQQASELVNGMIGRA